MQQVEIEKERLRAIEEPLLKWFQANKRSLMWRDDPTPYHVWVSEIMLQQTRVEACLLNTSPSPRDKRQSRMPSCA